MRTTRILILLMIPLIIEAVIACCNCDDIPETNYSTYWYYTNVGMLISSVDNSGPVPVIAQKDSVNSCAYGIRLVIDRAELEQDTTNMYWGMTPLPEKQQHREGLIQSAYAFEPCRCMEERMLIPADTILSLEVISNNDFDSSHPAGSNLADLFMILKNDYLSETKDISFVSTWQYYEDEELILLLNLLLMQEPENAGLHDFTVRIILSDGRVMEESTQIKLHL